MKAQHTSEDDSERHFLCSQCPSTHPFGFDFLRIEGCHWDCPNSFTFWKGIVVVQFQGAVHTGKLAFTRGIPINETATENKGSSFRNRCRQSKERKRKRILLPSILITASSSVLENKRSTLSSQKQRLPQGSPAPTRCGRMDGSDQTPLLPSFLLLLEYSCFTTSC